MRPGQNKRMRGRNNNNNGGNRKGPNPLTRSYESNGPDVKIRGNAHHVAEKYLQLARDAQSSGDPVAAESYLQHAEHYFRLIASAQQAQLSVNRPQIDGAEAESDDDDDNGIPDRFASPPAASPYVPQPFSGAERQPYGGGERPPYNGGGERQPYSGGERQPAVGNERQPYAERPSYNGERAPQQDRTGFVPRNDRQERGGQDRNGRRAFRDNGERSGEIRAGDDRGSERFDRNRNPNRNGQDRGYDRAGPERAFQDRPYAQPVTEQPARDPAAGEQPRIEAAERRPEGIAPAPLAAPAGPAPMPRFEPPRAASAPEDAPGLPSFITTPTRVISPEPTTEAGAPPSSAFPGDEGVEPTKFPRRRRRPTRVAAADAVETAIDQAPDGD